MNLLDNVIGSVTDFGSMVLETSGEILGGAVDQVADFSGNWVGNKLSNEAARTESANPESNRTSGTEAVQPTGDPVVTNSGSTSMDAVKAAAPWLFGGVAVAALAYYAVKG